MDALPNKLTVEQWEEQRWSDLDKEPGFHRKVYSPALVKYIDKLFPDGKHGRVFIPLCGKTLDMIYLADQGHEVIGLEYSKGAITRFHEENALTYTEENKEMPFTVYHTKEKNITIYQGDLFDMNSNICGQFDAVFDRGSYVAINVDDHKAYSNLMSSIIRPGGQILMEALCYESSTFLGPPHSISENNLTANFTEFEISTLEEYDYKISIVTATDDMKTVCRLVLLKRK